MKKIIFVILLLICFALFAYTLDKKPDIKPNPKSLGIKEYTNTPVKGSDIDSQDGYYSVKGDITTLDKRSDFMNLIRKTSDDNIIEYKDIRGKTILLPTRKGSTDRESSYDEYLYEIKDSIPFKDTIRIDNSDKKNPWGLLGSDVYAVLDSSYREPETRQDYMKLDFYFTKASPDSYLTLHKTVENSKAKKMAAFILKVKTSPACIMTFKFTDNNGLVIQRKVISKYTSFSSKGWKEFRIALKSRDAKPGDASVEDRFQRLVRIDITIDMSNTLRTNGTILFEDIEIAYDDGSDETKDIFENKDLFALPYGTYIKEPGGTGINGIFSDLMSDQKRSEERMLKTADDKVKAQIAAHERIENLLIASTIDDFNTKSYWQLLKSNADANLYTNYKDSDSDSGCMKLDFNFTKSSPNSYLILRKSIKDIQDKRLIAINFKVKKNCDNNLIFKFTDNNGFILQKTKILPKSNQWQDVTFYFIERGDIMSGIAPIEAHFDKLASIDIRIDTANALDKKGTVLIDDLKAVYKKEAFRPHSALAEKPGKLITYPITDFKNANPFAPAFTSANKDAQFKDKILSYSLNGINSAGIQSDIMFRGNVKDLILKLTTDRKGLEMQITFYQNKNKSHVVFNNLPKGEQKLVIPCPASLFRDLLLNQGINLKIDITSNTPCKGKVKFESIYCNGQVFNDSPIPSNPLVFLSKGRFINDRAEYEVAIQNLSDKDIKTNVECFIKDLYGNKIKDYKKEINLKAKGKIESIKISQDMTGYNLLYGDFKFTANGNDYRSNYGGDEIARPIKNITNPKMDNNFGFAMNLYLNQLTDYSQMKKIAETAKSMGAKWIAEDFYPADEKYWKNYDLTVKAASSAGIDICGVITYPINNINVFKSNGEYYDFVKKLTTRYKNKVKYWEIKPSNNSGSGVYAYQSDYQTLKQIYFPVEKDTYKIIKKNDPSAKVIKQLPFTDDDHIINDGINNRPAFDILAFQQNETFFDNGETFERRTKKLQNITKYTNIKSVWLLDNTINSDRIEPANKMIVNYIKTLAISSIKYIPYYYSDYKYMTTNPACRAYKVATDKLEGAAFKKKLKLGGDITAYEFKKQNNSIIVLWSKDGGVFKINDSNAKITNIIGETVTNKGTIKLISGSPVYITGKNISVKKIK